MKMLNIRFTPLFAESWNVAWRKKERGSILFDRDTPFIIIKNSYRYWAADPFVIEKDGKTYIFSELYDYIKCRGILGCCELKERGEIKWVPIITEKFHLSYPYIIESKDKIFLMPESEAGNSLLLYEAIDFPYKWKKVKILRDNVNYADTTPLIWKEQRFALTHNVKDPFHPKLLMIDLDNECPDKEIETDSPLRTRPAGKNFMLDHACIRPAQNSTNCNDGYGKNLIFYEYYIDGESCYSEKVLSEIFPEDLCYTTKIYLDGMHTYNSSEHFEVVDIKTRRFNLLNLGFRILRKIIK